MKKYIIYFSFLFVSAGLIAQEETSLGDHFSLEGALSIFKESSSLEEFEKKLNQEGSDVNNLDLNEDGEIDYLRVEDHHEDDVHAIIIQAVLSSDEAQDVAVIELEKTGEESALLQIVGDEALYGEEKIVEPYETTATSSGNGPSYEYELARVVINVWGWGIVRTVYGPRYRVYRSPFYWGYYPGWYRPWRPRPIRTFVAAVTPFRVGFRVTNKHRVVKARKIYTPRKRTSQTVKVRASKTTVVKGKNGNVAARKTTVSKAGKTNGNTKVKKSKKTQTTKVKTKNGKAKATKKTKKVKKKKKNG